MTFKPSEQSIFMLELVASNSWLNLGHMIDFIALYKDHIVSRLLGQEIEMPPVRIKEHYQITIYTMWLNQIMQAARTGIPRGRS
jgi:hypothetical protein